ncbi:MAG: methylated-DNA--[protein]-cysteine S-methyltransferase [Dehalococcoidia bacterium]|nr:methylated-DNA--[protein]-cysteine S-methyltransferase [Dehalococcoidia bacterium]
MTRLRYDLFPTEMGWVAALSTDSGLRRLALKPLPQEAMDELGSAASGASLDPDALEDVRLRLEAHFRGEDGAFDQVPLDLEDAPPFFKAAWEACRRIPRGETRSYQWLAAQAGNPRASRAAGQAMAKNRLAVIIPCHRVIGSNGGLHGYGGGGLEKKARLLQMERVGPGNGAEPASVPGPTTGPEPVPAEAVRPPSPRPASPLGARTARSSGRR